MATSFEASNLLEHIKARRKAGITGCLKCRDTGRVQRSRSAGRGLIGCRIWTEYCGVCVRLTQEFQDLTAKLRELL